MVFKEMLNFFCWFVGVGFLGGGGGELLIDYSVVCMLSPWIYNT